MSEERLFSRPFLLCSLANLAQGLAFNLYLHFPGFLKQLGARELEIGLIAGVANVAALLSRPAIGRVMDGRGRRPVILAGAALNVAVCFLYLSVSRVGPWVYAVRVGHGLAEAMLFTGLFTFAADYVPAARRNQGLALFGVSGMLPIALGGLLGDWILERAPYAALFTASAGFALLTGVLSLPLRDHHPPAAAGERSRGLRAAALQRDLLPVWGVGLAFSVALTAAFVFLKLFVVETGIGSVGRFFSTYAGAALVLRIVAGWLPDRVGPERVLYPSLLALAAGFGCLATASSAWEVSLAGLLCGIGHGYVFPILFGLVVTRAREAERGAAMSIFTGLFEAGALVGGPLLGAIVQGARFPAMFATAAGIVVVGGGVFAWAERRRRGEAVGAVG